MKNLVLLSSALFLSLSFMIPFAFSGELESATGAPVVDLQNRTLQLGVPYYILSSHFLIPKGLCLADVKNHSNPPHEHCLHDVVKCTLFRDPLFGLPVIFSPVHHTQDTVVREDTPYHIQFSVNATGTCASHTVWTVVDSVMPYCKHVKVHGHSLVHFKVQKKGHGYKIVFCPFFPIPIPLDLYCHSLGFKFDNGYHRLASGLCALEAEFYFHGTGTRPILQNPGAF